ncbi:MAG TPA: n-acetylglutamate synthase [Fibrella sp.]
MNYHDKVFRAVANTANGETSSETLFHYRQLGSVLTADYSGGRIVTGHLLGLVDEVGNLDFRYHQLNADGQLMTGRCQSTPEVLPGGKIRLHETWQWTSGDESSGTSIVEEV